MRICNRGSERSDLDWGLPIENRSMGEHRAKFKVSGERRVVKKDGTPKGLGEWRRESCNSHLLCEIKRIFLW
jgi:hypothetical protein